MITITNLPQPTGSPAPKTVPASPLPWGTPALGGVVGGLQPPQPKRS